MERLRDSRTRDHAFRDLLELYQERIYWHIRKFVFEHEDANDIVQNTFIKAYRGLDGFKGDAKIYTWLYRIASNESITFLNKNKKRQSGSLDAAQALEADAFFDGDEAQMMLQKALGELPDKQRLVFNMKYYDDMTYQQMSEILDTSVGALKASFHHAVKKIEFYFKKVQI
ncbi:MAG: sigma-70 family RNA polymerase sigma factor [Saprospiraceae bacterium]|nr:sigma-70 family RNA polymerase sigma factor [Saprospiraceae bacterium]